jgi:hypothetical protein
LVKRQKSLLSPIMSSFTVRRERLRDALGQQRSAVGVRCESGRNGLRMRHGDYEGRGGSTFRAPTKPDFRNSVFHASTSTRLERPLLGESLTNHSPRLMSGIASESVASEPPYGF